MYNCAEALLYQREVAGLSQSALAKATGISQQKISYYESGKHSPPIEDCLRLADFYGITLDELVGRDFGGNGDKRTTISNSFNGAKIGGDIKF